MLRPVIIETARLSPHRRDIQVARFTPTTRLRSPHPDHARSRPALLEVAHPSGPSAVAASEPTC